MVKKEKALSTADKMKLINSDIELWLLNFVKILDNNNEMIPFKVNAQQKDFIKNKGRFNLILKSRQLGFSTNSLGLMLFNAYQRPNTNYLMCCHDADSLQFLFNRLKMMADSIPDSIKIEQKRSNRTELLFENNSRIAVKVFGKNVGRGMTNQIIHLSEFGLCEAQVQKMGLVSVEQSLAKNKDSMLIIESTAGGIDNTFYSLWQDIERGQSKYKGFFYPWTTKTHTDQFKHEIDEAVEWWKSTYGKGKPLSGSDILATTPYEKMLLEKTKVTLRQLMWRQFKKIDMKEQFEVEYPAFPREAFIATSNNVFDAERVLNAFNYIPEPLKHVEGLPLSLQRYLGSGLNIYEPPKKGEWYFGSADTSAGLKQDGSAICILDSSANQVATFNRNDIPTYKFADIIYDLGHFYNYMVIMIERNSYGIDILQRLYKEKQYINLNRTKKKDQFGRAKWELGWYSTNVSKTIMINDLKEYFETGLITINDKETLEQMQIYQEDKGKFGNAKGSGNYDDLVDALGLSLQSLKLGRYMV